MITPSIAVDLGTFCGRENVRNCVSRLTADSGKPPNGPAVHRPEPRRDEAELSEHSKAAVRVRCNCESCARFLRAALRRFSLVTTRTRRTQQVTPDLDETRRRKDRSEDRCDPIDQLAAILGASV